MTNTRPILPIELTKNLHLLPPAERQAGHREHTVVGVGVAENDEVINGKANELPRIPLSFVLRSEGQQLGWVYEGPMIVGLDSVEQVQDAIGATQLDMTALDSGLAHVVAFFQSPN